MCQRHDVIAGSSAPISLIQNLFSQHEIASTGEQIVMVGIPVALSQSLPSFRCSFSIVYQKSLNVSAELKCLQVKGLNSTESKTHVRCL